MKEHFNDKFYCLTLYVCHLGIWIPWMWAYTWGLWLLRSWIATNSDWCSPFTGNGMWQDQFNVYFDGEQLMDWNNLVKSQVTAQLEGAEQKYLGDALLWRKHSVVCLYLGNFFFLSSYPPEGGSVITEASIFFVVCCLCRAFWASISGRYICVKSQNAREFN